jgi:hypothetical protein
LCRAARRPHDEDEDEDLRLLGCIGAGAQRHPAQHLGEHQVRESEGHGEIMLPGAVDGDCEVGSLALNALIRGCVTVLGTHRQRDPVAGRWNLAPQLELVRMCAHLDTE